MHRLIHYRSHPWHGLSLGDDAPEVVNCYIEMVPTDTVKYEIDKETGILKVDRPQKYSSLCPTLYGFLPRTYAGKESGKHCSAKTGLKNIVGDGDPVDVCVLTEKAIPRGDIILRAIPIGGFRLLDGNEADDKIISVLLNDFVFGEFKDLSDCPEELILRLKHYFLTYKDYPGSTKSRVQIIERFNAEEAREVIKIAQTDYEETFYAKKGRGKKKSK